MALVFGRRIRKQWEYEAGFLDANGREFGELDIELSRIEKQDADYTLKANFRMRHPSLVQHQAVQVYIDDVLVLEGRVATAGRITLGARHLQRAPGSVASGQQCRIVAGGEELVSAALIAG